MMNYMDLIMMVLGMCVGSFVNMLLYRTAVTYGLRKNKFKVKDSKRSFCDYCGRQLNWYENVPVISWLIQSGKTRCCKKKLGWSYPVIELGMGLVFLCYWRLSYGGDMLTWQNVLELILGLMILTLMWFSLWFDLGYMILPDFSTILLVLFTIGYLYMTNELSWVNIISAFGFSGFFLLIYLWTKGRGMGFGDVKLGLFIGLLLGWPNMLAAFYFAFVIGAMVGIIILLRGGSRKQEIPFGPFLLAGTVFGWWWGEKIMYYVISRWF